MPFAPGDVVYQGEIIAYTGKTGNAWDVVPYPHLHLSCWTNTSNGGITFFNPEVFINGTVQWNNSNHTSVTTTVINNIECNE